MLIVFKLKLLALNILRPLSLLLETLSDGNPEIVMYCTATLANIAMTVDNHMQVCLIFLDYDTLSFKLEQKHLRTLLRGA